MELMDRLAKERRGRLAAERLLEQKSRELFAANEKLALHARALSDQIVEQRQMVKSALSEAEALKGQNLRFLNDLERAHTAAVMAERRLWDSIDTIRDGFAVFDGANRLVAANAAFRRLFECDDILPGQGYVAILAIIAENGVVDIGDEAPQDWCARMVSRWDQEPLEPVVLHLTSGQWVRLVDRRARDGDMVSLAVDITEQMRIWAAIEAIPDGFVLFDREDRLMVCNQRYRDLYAESAPAMVPGASFEAILRYGLQHGQYADAMGREEEWLQERLAMRGAPSVEFEHAISGNRWLRVIDKATPDGGRVGLRVDITEARDQKAALESAREAAEAAVRAKSAFLANMSHEIRTPMNGVVGMAELLCDTPLSDEQRLFADTIRSSGEALLVIINDILDYSKIEAERLTLHPEPFDLERVIHEVAMLLQPRARPKGVDLLIDFDMFLPTRYVGDPGRLRQVLTNLMGNAVKFTEQGHVLVRVVGIEAGDGCQQLHITVEDTGIGIAPENLDHIFGEFNQVDSASNRKFEGTGLGLAITQRLVEHMGGAVWVDSEPGRGSCFGFRLSLPVAEQSDETPGPITLRRALVIDDQFINRTILERQLTTCGIAVTLCRSLAEAQPILEADPGHDVILCSHALPELDALTFLQEIRAAGIETPVLILSSNPATLRDAPGAEAVAGFLQKPVLRADLYRKLQALSPGVAGSRAVAELRQMRVLAAEDNRTNQLVFRKMVRDFDMDLVFANNGREAVDLFTSFAPDLIFMDISMPEMDGREAARAIRTQEGGRGHVPIIALTAHAMEGDAESILAAGIDRYLTKPLRRNAITEALSSLAPAGVRPPVPADQDTSSAA
ncbi:hybrid sensor histidine kinase/response regulator [Gemmobacter caeruleus]|uniref:hybrid sensor histidine kinase/response regulator n=1 Tax=Gemmobacter caeruleus TaxID=2595004 RepID=UPI0011EE68B2|nr:response regulator [Gemmobacter caeruleus]